MVRIEVDGKLKNMFVDSKEIVQKAKDEDIRSLGLAIQSIYGRTARQLLDPEWPGNKLTGDDNNIEKLAIVVASMLDTKDLSKRPSAMQLVYGGMGGYFLLETLGERGDFSELNGFKKFREAEIAAKRAYAVA